MSNSQKNLMNFVHENCRLDRCRNIAVVILRAAGLSEHNQPIEVKEKRTFINVEKIRKIIREALGLPVLLGENHFGDMRAHGDAIGGHGLYLDTTKHNGKKYVELSRQNLEKCQECINKAPEAEFID